MRSYSDAGVDVAAADRFAQSLSATVTSTWGDNVVGAFGGFAAGLTLPAGYDEPVLMMTTDGIGTKIEIARRQGMYEGLGHDLVAMCVDDLAAQGATPLGFTDYLAVGALEPARDATLVTSVATACRAAGCALLGGETAVHPGVMEPGQFDMAGAALGVVERENIPDPADVGPGDAVVGLVSPNLRSNGFSLVRSVFSGSDYDTPLFDSTLGSALLEPSVIYAPAVLASREQLPIHGLAHITGGGLVGNLPRVLPEGLTAELDAAAWSPAPIFGFIQDQGGIERAEMFSTFNMGIGFALIMPAGAVDDAVAVLAAHGHRAEPIGRVVTGDRVTIVP